METYRLKNIVILLLLILNIFLLFLVGSRYYAQYQAQQDLVEQTVALLESNDISIDPTLLKEEELPPTYSYTRKEEEELSFAASLLGEITEQSDSGGGTYVYATPTGSAIFRSNGSFTLEFFSPVLQMSDPEQFVREHCPSNYQLTNTEHSGRETLLTLTPYTDGRPVYNASIVFQFEEGALLSASGYFIPSGSETGSTGTAITKCSAAVYLMDYCSEEGRICNDITDISVGYLLQSTTSNPLLLTPVYRIDTNTYAYYVNASSGHVSVAR